MRCPSCGTQVDEALDVCPACHARLGATRAVRDDDVRWCASCGSPIPVGYDVCPTCGMPVAGAFEEEEAPEEGPAEDSPAELPPLISALPETPLDGTDTSLAQSRPDRLRQMVIAAAAALLVVGGTTLFITRPWDPHAFDTHATEEADTSMAGFPGRVSHLTSQDFVETLKYEEYVLGAQKKLVAFRGRMPKWALAARSSRRTLERCLRTGDFAGIADGLSLARELDEDLGASADELEGLTLSDDAQQAERSELLVLAGYLREETSVLLGAWSAADRASSAEEARIDAQAQLSAAMDGHTIGEWHELFVNAWLASEA